MSPEKEEFSPAMEVQILATPFVSVKFDDLIGCLLKFRDFWNNIVCRWIIFPEFSEALQSLEASGNIYPIYFNFHLFPSNFILLITGRHMPQLMLGFIQS
jgi:hypothetical protein